METRIKYIKKNNKWFYAIQVKKWIFWKTLNLCDTWLAVEQFFDFLAKVEEYNDKNSGPKSVNKVVYTGYGVRSVFPSGQSHGSLGFFTAYPKKIEGKDRGIDWSGPHGDVLPLVDIRLPKLFGKEYLEPTKLRITIEQIEE